MGLLAFLVIAGPRFLDPTNVAWLVGGDPLQHYLGWAFYRNSPWTWPIGLNPLYGMEFSNSIVFTDSIPLLAIPFKAVNFLLPYPFQYLGIWVLLCFVLQAYFAFRLIGLISGNPLIQCLGSILFLYAPPLLFRLSLHESLMGHFLILAALYLNLKKVKIKYLHSLAWVFLLSMAVLTHFYLAVMVFVLWLSNLITRMFISKQASLKDAMLEVLAIFLSSCFVAWQAGYFAIQGASGVTRGFGDFRTNLLALFNSRGWSYLLRPIPLRDSVEAATGEGFQYLGAGSLFILLCAIYAFLIKRVHLIQSFKTLCKNNWPLLAVLMVLALISFSNNIGFGPWNLVFPLPDFLIAILSLVRASSRLFWPLYYSILLGMIWVLINAYHKKTLIVIFFLAALLQIFDTSAGWLITREKVNLLETTKFKTVLQSPFWEQAGRHYKNIVSSGGQEHWGPFGILASSNRMSTNIAYLARTDLNKVIESENKVSDQLHIGPLDASSLYVLPDWKINPDRIRFDPKTDLLARIDGINILAPGWKECRNCEQVPKNFEKNQLAPELHLGQVVYFTKNGEGRENFMLSGWGFTEDWGTWATEPKAKIVVPMPAGNPSKLIIGANAFLPKGHPVQVVNIAVNDIPVAHHLMLAKAKENILEIDLPKGIKIPGDPVVIEFQSIDSVSPQDSGIGPDGRKLGLGLVSIQFVR